MNYRSRHLEKRLVELARYFKVVLVTGARQVGKTTLLTHVFPRVKSVVFDPIQDLYGARRDPDLFLDNFGRPLILDEVQYVPELLPAIKRRVDQLDEPGQYLLTGSQNLSVIKSVSESLAGRVCVLHLGSMSLQEIAGEGAADPWLAAYLDRPAAIREVLSGTLAEPVPLTRVLWRGTMPATLDHPDGFIPDFYRSYIQTYVERDIRSLGDIRALAEFDRFLGLSGALSGQEINASQLGRDVGVNPATARKWLELLNTTYQWLELFPYSGNAVKRVSGKRKGHLCDTGMACYLQRISSPDALAVHPLLGLLFETFVVNMLHRQFATLAVPPQAYHWRTNGGAEVDLVLERDGQLYPVEIKCKRHLSGHDVRGIRAFRETYGDDRVMHGLVVYAGAETYRLADFATAVPWNARVG